MFVTYDFVWSIGRNTHNVKIFDNASNMEEALDSEPSVIIESSRAADVLKQARDILNRNQIDALRFWMKVPNRPSWTVFISPSAEWSFSR